MNHIEFMEREIAARKRKHEERDAAFAAANDAVRIARDRDRTDEIISEPALARRRALAKTVPVTVGHGWQMAFVINDLEAIPMDRLKPWLRLEHIEAAIRMGIRLGMTELPGVRIFKPAGPRWPRKKGAR